MKRLDLVSISSESVARAGSEEVSGLFGPGIRYVIFLALVGSIALCSPADLVEPAAPVPELRTDGTPPTSPKGQFVFLDPKTGDGVAIYPRAMGADDRSLSGEMMRVPIPLSRHTEPEVRVEVTRSWEGEYVYKYEFLNGPNARQAVRLWLLDIPTESIIRVQTPERWRHSLPPAGLAERQRHLPHELTVPSRALQLTASAPDAAVSPGTRQSGFIVVSKYRPGFAKCFVRGNSRTVEFPEEPPGSVEDQVRAITGLPYNVRRAVTIGPRFEPEASEQMIARDFLDWIEGLTKAGMLESNSVFVQQVVKLLRTVGEKATGAAGRMKVVAEPTTEMEIDIWNALRLNGIIDG